MANTPLQNHRQLLHAVLATLQVAVSGDRRDNVIINNN